MLLLIVLISRILILVIENIHNNCEKYPEIWKVCIFIFTLRNRKNTVERVLSLNKDSLKNNLDSSTLEALRFSL